MSKRLLLLLMAFTAACAAEPAKPLALADLPAINTDRILQDIRTLSSDEFEGRFPGSKGETLTVQYLTDQLKAIGLEPGNPDGTWIQKVGLVGIKPEPVGGFFVRKGAATHEFNINKDVVVFSRHVTDEVKLDNSEMVFVGYGVQAPELNWDDFKGMDVKGKTIVVLVNDPPVKNADGSLDDKTFGGKAMTYYGRWTYKYEKAAELGAAGVIIVHETEPAAYPFSVVQNNSGERFNLVTPDKNMSRSAIEGWISFEAATELFRMGGQDYQKLKALAATREFKPVPLGVTASVTVKQQMRTIDSANVVAKLTGRAPALKDEFVTYTAHWDHLGVGTPKDGDAIYNGAADNASGVAMLMEIARGFKAVSPAPERSILFIFVTAEEQGLLGSQYYADFPLYPLNKTVANINIDGINQWGRTSDLTVIGLGASDLDDYAAAAAAEQSRVLKADQEPEKGFYYRSDHFNFAKKGVPAFDPDSGITFIGKPPEYGKTKREQYTKNDYHSPSDQVKPDWDLSGAAEDGRLFLAVGYRVANADTFPQWKPGNEFKSIRDKALASK
ncbi:MAG TPA: M28 family metallopeptidase [Vicinamibacterales bacterium]|nr:M28 family metallopeptidase [Vicinamibacterales bacterium]